MTFFARLREERKRMKLTQTALAEIGGIVKKTQVVYESGKGATPSADYLEKIAIAGIDVQYLLTGTRSETALSTEERLLIKSYREASPAIQKATLAVLISGGTGGQGVTVNGNVTGSIVAHTIEGRKR